MANVKNVACTNAYHDTHIPGTKNNIMTSISPTGYVKFHFLILDLYLDKEVPGDKNIFKSLLSSSQVTC